MAQEPYVRNVLKTHEDAIEGLGQRVSLLAEVSNNNGTLLNDVLKDQSRHERDLQETKSGLEKQIKQLTERVVGFQNLKFLDKLRWVFFGTLPRL